MSNDGQKKINVADDDEWEEVTVVAELSGVLDTTSTRMAIQNGNCAVRRAGTDTPFVQIGKALYAGQWTSTLGSDLIFEQKGNHLEFCAVSESRLNAVKALVTTEEDNKTST